MCTKVGAADRARASERAVERAAFFRKLGRSALLYVGIAVAMRLVPKALDGTLGEVLVGPPRWLYDWWSARGGGVVDDGWEIDDEGGGNAAIFASSGVALPNA